MPTLRQPWVRLWVEALEHPKIALLSDSQYRTWTACLLRASQQPHRWTFQSVAQAAAVTGRPKAQVQALVGSLLDVQQDGTVIIHDWQIWQRRGLHEESTMRTRSLQDPNVKHSGSERETSSYAREDKDKDKEDVVAAGGLSRAYAREEHGFQPLGGLLPRRRRTAAAAAAESSDLPDEVRQRLAQPPIGADDADT